MRTRLPHPELKRSRRQFLKNAGGVLFYVSVPIGFTSLASCLDRSTSQKDLALAELPPTEGQAVSVWVQIHSDDRITITNPTNEMGQGSMTALAVLIAEELDADWSKVHIENSPVEAEIYGSQGWSGYSMMTVGSRTVMSYYDSLRQAGAQARYVLLHNAAEHWDVPISELITKPNTVLHPASDRRISYGEIATFVQPIQEIPEIPAAQLKQPENFRLIGKVADRFDIPAKVDGSAMYAIDVQVPDMVYGVISRSPVHGAAPTLINEEAIRAMEGVLDLVTLDHGIGVIASSVELALKAKGQLQIDWSKGAIAESHTSSTAYAVYEQKASGRTTNGRAIVNKGNVENAFRNAVKTYTSDYRNDYVYHAQMEPLNAIASVAEDGSEVEIWVGTQSPANTKSAVARLLGIEPSFVTIHRQFLGGGFGRRAHSDWVLETVQLARDSKRTVKLIWTREDDLQYGMYRPMSLQRMTASIDRSGNVSGWQHIIVGTGRGLLGSGAETHFYTFPNQHVEVRNIDHGVRTKHWRAVAHGPNKLAIEGFIDEIAEDQNVDPFDFRMRLMKDHPRAQQVLQTVADMADWKSPAPAGRAKGIAFAERSSSLAACVCELSVNRENGTIKVHRLWASLDAGVVVQPDNAIAQMEGGMIMGISSVLKESITFKDGRVEQSNYHDYPIMRIDEVPDSIEVKIIPSQERPTGIGESGIPIIGGAIANAFARLTGKRIRHIPFTPEKVLDVLAG